MTVKIDLCKYVSELGQRFRRCDEPERQLWIFVFIFLRVY